MIYKTIQDIYKVRNGKTISTCAIADAKRKLGYPVKISINRKNKNKIQKSATEKEIKEVSRILNGK
jgi:hypothetical protein